MAYNFICGDRDQLLLLPQDMRDWLPGKHLAFFMLDIVSQLNLSEFRRFYNPDGVGNAAYDPSMMVALYFYSYCVGERSSRKIEELCRESVPYRVVSGGLQPDQRYHQKLWMGVEAGKKRAYPSVSNFTTK